MSASNSSAPNGQRGFSPGSTGFNVHIRVRVKTKTEAERVGKYMIRPLLSLERLSLDEKEAKVCYRHGKDRGEVDRIISHLKLTFVADRPPPPQIAYPEVLMAAETSAEDFS